jgi:hypothetical protein
MATVQYSPVTRYLRRITAAHADQLLDSTLLDRFADGHDEDAFAILVRRHGSLVLGACQRIVQDWHTAEDCFQAVFLVLASKARVLNRTESLIRQAGSQSWRSGQPRNHTLHHQGSSARSWQVSLRTSDRDKRGMGTGSR